MNRIIIGLLLLVFSLVRVEGQGVVASDSVKAVEIVHAKLLAQELENGLATQYLRGDVRLQQENVFVFCDSAKLNENNMVWAYGNITILHGDSVQVFADDSLVYDGNRQYAQLWGGVVLSDSLQQLFTERLDYDIKNKLATYHSGALLTNGESQLSSTHGYYHTDNGDAFFKKEVVIVHPTFNLKTDTLQFNTETQLATFLAPTIILQDDAKIYCEKGYYDILNEEAEFNQNPQFIKADQVAVSNRMIYDGKIKEYRLIGDALYEDDERRIRADEIVYDEINDAYTTVGGKEMKVGNANVDAEYTNYNPTTKETTLYGGVFVKDSNRILIADSTVYSEGVGKGRAWGEAYLKDTISGIGIIGKDIIFNNENNEMEATGRPMLVIEVENDNIIDTLFLSADSIYSEQRVKVDTLFKDTLGNYDLVYDTTQFLTGYPNVRIYKSDLQGICDSFAYNLTDSIIHLYQDPILWSDTSQFVGDTISILMKEEVIHRVFIKKNAFVINSEDEIFFNQIKGRNITAYFKAGEMDKVWVNGNGQTVYYSKGNDNLYMSAVKIICSEILINFVNNEVTKTRFYREPQTDIIPIQQHSKKEFTLRGFKWEKKLRPTSADDLGNDYFRNLLEKLKAKQ